MKTVITSAAAVLALVSAAFAGEMSGVIANVDPDARTLVLESGETFTIGEEVVLDGLAPGTQVVVTYDDGTTNATAITPAG